MRPIKMKTFRQRGIGLVEIMIGLVVSSLLIGGLIQIFSSNKQAYIMQDEMSRLQENGRFAFHFLTSDIRMAGYFGCKRDLEIQNNLNDTSSLEYQFGGDPLMAYHATDNGWSPALPSALSSLEKPPLNGSDVIAIRSASGSSVDLRPPYREDSQPASTLVVKDHGFQKGDIVVISDCTNATVVQLTGANGGGQSSAVTHNTGSGNPGNSTKDLGHNYGAGSTVAKIRTIAYYVAEGAGGTPALFRKVGADAAEELVDGVDKLRFSYGLDTNDDGRLNTYKESISAVERSQVLAVRMTLLLAGERSNIVDGEQTYLINGATSKSDDGRLRYIMASTATIRNRAP